MVWPDLRRTSRSPGRWCFSLPTTAATSRERNSLWTAASNMCRSFLRPCVHGRGVSMSTVHPILVTGAAGRVGGVGGAVVEGLRRRGLPVRALVRHADERADALRATGAEVVVGDLTGAGDVARALAGCRRVYFGMSVSPPYLEATVTAAAVAREHGDLE